MTQQNLVIVDTACANLSSVRFAFERLGVTPEVTADAARIAAADRVILPGVGTAQAAMRNLQRLELVETLQNLPAAGAWYLFRYAVINRLVSGRRRELFRRDSCTNGASASRRAATTTHGLEYGNRDWIQPAIAKHGHRGVVLLCA